MPKIAPFCAIKPSIALAEKVVITIENLSLEDAKQIAKNNSVTFVHLLVPNIEHRFLQGSKKQIAFKRINENFDDFLEAKVLFRDTKPGIYIYRITHNYKPQTGIWTITAIDDYLNNTVKKHEHTRADREKVLIEYLQQTEIDANPVLLTYHPKEALNQLIDKYCSNNPEISFLKEGAKHELWSVNTADDIDAIMAYFKNETSYLADGHHRAAAAATLGIERRKLNLKHTGNEPYNFFSSVYMATDQLEIYPFHRLIKDLNGLSENQLLEAVSKSFKVENISENELLPTKNHQFGVYLKHNFYKIEPLKASFATDVVGILDVSILQNNLLNPLLGIDDARTNSRISFVSSRAKSVKEILSLVDKGEFAIAFFLFPTTIEELINVADKGEVMPPKSTWFEPKFPVGLITHYLSN